MSEEGSARERALAATGDELAVLLHHASVDVLLALLDNPAMEETQLRLLLERKNLPSEILEEVARRKPLLKSYRVKRALAFHPRTPCLISLRLLRDHPSQRSLPNSRPAASAPRHAFQDPTVSPGSPARARSLRIGP